MRLRRCRDMMPVDGDAFALHLRRVAERRRETRSASSFRGNASHRGPRGNCSTTNGVACDQIGLVNDAPALEGPAVDPGEVSC